MRSAIERAAMRLLALCIPLLLAACAGNPFRGFQVEPGTPRAAVIAQLGIPTRSVPIIVNAAAGERLQYSLQPKGQQAMMVDLDSAGRVLSSRQVLTLTEFSRIAVGQWTRVDIEREFGPPAFVDRVSSWNGDILTYRWNDGVDMFYWVYLDSANTVQRAHPGMEFIDPPEPRQ
jgi:hypothetical protein